MSAIHDTVEILTDYAHRDLIETLEAYGSQPSEQHSEALHDLLTDYTKTALGLKHGRTAWPLSVGCGKTQSIVSFIAACHRLELNEVSVLVSQEKIEALCDLKRDLLAKGVPEDQIGLVHSYKFDAAHADAVLSGECDGLKPGFASLPNTPDYAGRRYLLMTHAMLKIRKDIDTFNTYNGQSRSLLVWDESLLKSRGRSLLVSNVDDSLGLLVRRVESMADPMANEVSLYLSECLSALKASCGDAITLPEKTPQELEAYGKVIRKVLASDGGGLNGGHADCLDSFLEFTQEALRRVDVGQSRGFITYDLLIPDHLQSVVILDASYVIRELVRQDKTISIAEGYQHVKSFSKVQIKQLKLPSGWHTFGKLKAGSPEIKVLVEGLLLQSASEAALIFTYKPRGHNTNHRKLIESALRQQGVDPDQMIEVEIRGEMVHRRRFNWLTWGMEIGLSKFSFCTHVYAFGIYRRSLVDLSASLAGQLTSLSSSKLENHKLLKDIELTEMFHSLYQAFGRGSDRETDAGEAKPMKASFISQEDFSELFQETMPGVKLTEWTSRHIKKDGKIEKAVRGIVEALDKLPSHCSEISVKVLRVNSGCSDVCSRTFNEAVKQVGLTHKTWVRDRRSFCRSPFG